MHRFVLVVIAVTLLSGSVVHAASYQTWDGTIVDPILYTWGSTHLYSGIDLEPNADLVGAYLYCADLTGANLTGATLTGANLDSVVLTGADLKGLNKPA